MREHSKRYHFFLLMYREWGRYGIPRLAAARIVLQLQLLLGENIARFIETLITNAREQTSGTLLVVGVGLLAWSATNIFMQTKAVLNTSGA